MVKLVILLLTGPYIECDCLRYRCSSDPSSRGRSLTTLFFFTDDTLSTPIQSTSTSIAEDITMTQSDVNTRCPYTGKDMINPVKNKHCGHHYDKEGITHYIKIKGKKAK